MEIIEIYIARDEDIRLDTYLSQQLDGLSRTRIKDLIKGKYILVNDKSKNPKYLVKKGDYIKVKIPEPKEIEIIPENIPIDIVYEDRDIVIVNKSQNTVVHPASGHYTKTLVNALLYH